MNSQNYLKRVLLVAVTWMSLCSAVYSQTISRLSSSFLARGEQALLEVVVIGAQITEIPEVPKVKNLAIQFSGRAPQTNLLPGRKLEYAYGFIVSSYETGKYVIPAIRVMVNGAITETEPLDIEVFNPDDLKWSEVQSGDKLIRYASSFHIMNSSPYENQTTATEIKVYVPEEILVQDWGIPDFERDGVTAWRFQPSLMKSRVNLLGMRYVSVAYPSTITPTRVGKVAIGPAKIRLTTQERVLDPFPRAVDVEIYLQVPKLEIESIELPPNAPLGFENAVGSFKLTASSNSTEVLEGDPISIDLMVSGSGNLDTMRPPSLENPSGWKVYGTTNEQRGDERRQLSGSVVFHQSIRPLEMKSEIPSFRLVYFDPADESYKTLLSDPIALQMKPNKSAGVAGTPAVQALPMPIERMTDILAVVHPNHLTDPLVRSLPNGLWHFVAGLIALALIGKAVWMRQAGKFKKSPRHQEWLRELEKIINMKSTDEVEFLQAAGGFVERWHGENSPTEFLELLTERDAICFRSEKKMTAIDPKFRDRIIKLLRKTAVACLFITTLGLGAHAQAEDIATKALDAYEAAKYDDAIKLWFSAGNYDQLSADTLYNIGNACYRSSSPGQAALFYRRALVRDPSHQESLQNLRFIERKFGAIVVQRPSFQYALTKFSLTTWQSAYWVGVWICGLAVLVFPATHRGARIRIVAIAALVLGPILISVGFLGWRYFPNDSEFAPLAKQAVVTVEKVALHTDAARTAPEVIDAPPGSLCEIIAESGRWVYVAFATKTRGWVPIESIEKIIPKKTPEPPKFRKPKAGEKTA